MMPDMTSELRELLAAISCEFKPVKESKRYPLQAQQCEDPAAAGKTRNRGLNHIRMGEILTAADWNNLGCADAWVQPPEWEDAKEKFERANSQETTGYEDLSDESKKIIQANHTLFTKPDDDDGVIVQPYGVLLSLAREALKALLEGLRAGFHIELK